MKSQSRLKMERDGREIGQISRRDLLCKTGGTVLAGIVGGLATNAVLAKPALALFGGKKPRLTTHKADLGLNVSRPLRIVQLTDLHAGPTTDPDLVRGAIEVCRKASPDLVVLTGDYFTANLQPLDELLETLERLPKPAVAVLGNHDHGVGSKEVSLAFQKHDIEVLRNANTELDLGGSLGRLVLVGVDDAHSRNDDVSTAYKGLSLFQRSKALTITHRGEVVDKVVGHGGRLLLSGHTHGGQVSIPFLTIPMARSQGLTYLAGWYRVGPCRLYVNAGIGTASFPFRLGRSAQPEVSILELT